MPIFGTEYVLSTAAQAGNIALADNDFIRGSFKEYLTAADLSYSASNFPDRFKTGQIVYVSQSNQLFRISIVFDEINEINVLTTQSFEFPSSGGGGSTDISALNAFTSSAQTSLTALNAATSSYILASQTSSMSVLSALTASYLIGGVGTIDTSSFVTNDQTSSMSVATASFISDTFISASAARSGFGTTTLPSGVLSSSAQIAVEISGAFTEVSGGLAGRITTLETTSGGDVTALNLFTSSIQTQVDNLTAETSSYLTSADTASFIVASQTSSMNVLSALTASYLIGGVGTIDTSSFVTNDQTSSFLTSADTASLVRVDQTSSMSVATASYVDPTFISASAAAAGFGSGGGSVGTLQQVTDQGTSTTNAITASAFSGSYFDFNTDGNPVSAVAGRLTWNESDGTLNIGMGYADVVLQVGQEQHYVVRNNTGTTISNGVAVYASGSTSGLGRIEAAPYTANGLIREVRFLGLATHDISDGVNGVVTRFGYVRDLDTRGTAATPISVGDEDWSVGDILYVHPTVAGKLTNVKPKHAVYVAIVTVRHQSTGVLFVRPFSYGHMDDIHDVSINTSSLAMGDVLVYNSSSDVWENSDSVNLALTASYISPTFISASAAAAGFGSGGGASIPAGTVSSSAQTVANLVGQNVVVNTITAQQYVVSSSVSFITTSFSSGSTAFGDTLSDTHTFTGSVSITGSLNIGGPFTVNNENLNVSSGSIILTNSSSIVVLDSGIISGTFVGNLNYDYITNLPNLISSSAQIALLGAGILSASAQIASDISGAFTSLSSSFASRITALEGAGGGSGIFTLTGSFYSTTNNVKITGSLSVGSGSFKSFEVNSDGFVVLGDMDKDLNTAPIGTVVYSGSSFYLIS